MVTPQINKLCAQLHWSGDRPATDYEPYTESTIILPSIPQMSECGLAGIYDDGVLVQDVIDYEKNVYIKRIGKDNSGFYVLETAMIYPINDNIVQNCICCDSGTEEFKDCRLPLTANIIFYMRSLVSEIRNFFDRLMDGQKISDATVLADKLIQVIKYSNTSS